MKRRIYNACISFQSLQGAIKSKIEIELDATGDRFQSLQGAIKSVSGELSVPFQNYFNLSKVQLKAVKLVMQNRVNFNKKQ